MKQIPINAFRFCKITVTLLVWLAYAFKSLPLLIIVLLILGFSAWLKIQRAPLIVLYSKTIEKIRPSRMIEVHEKGLRFAHSLGTALCAICIGLTLLFPTVGWWYVLAFAILKTVSMLGLCPGEALYACYAEGSCSILKK
ncbi:DUF4395 family protein [Mangrovibacterium marinum]|uniref:Uncharacterized protein DUF4395 n=1 Tax=Mangrovibacterium marinum TaxID=1639118 RepID=A0A2T5C498_9BACT|nr:DUF4395 family protein [Mangrovibacterium marinum]PTN09598.1 uncharacterized protein DUF4395 [Mangrovibacterium marinum]